MIVLTVPEMAELIFVESRCLTKRDSARIAKLLQEADCLKEATGKVKTYEGLGDAL